MTISSLRARAEMLGIRDSCQVDRVHLVRAIQQYEGHAPCFCTRYCDGCIRRACSWRYECTAEVIPCHRAEPYRRAA